MFVHQNLTKKVKLQRVKRHLESNHVVYAFTALSFLKQKIVKLEWMMILKCIKRWLTFQIKCWHHS